MGFSCGIVGLPNVGKSTLFNAITQNTVQASNYPFCTIDPNYGTVAVPDTRLDRLQTISDSRKKTHTTVDLVDIAGLVQGASKGEGLGNQFLNNIRQVDAVIQVVRLFKDRNVIREKEIDPLNDIDVINTELILSDMNVCEKRIAKMKKIYRSQNDKKAAAVIELLEKVVARLSDGHLLHDFHFTRADQELVIRELSLLTVKPMLIVANISEDEIKSYTENPLYDKLASYCNDHSLPLMELSAKIESEISELDDKSAAEYKEMIGISSSGLERMIVAGYNLLDLITFFTTGPKESRAWTVRAGATAPEAAGVIHSDFQRGFIKAEVVSYDVLDKLGSYAACRDKGSIRIEGKDYQVKDGDVCLFRFNV
ncbi:MAG TPA: redox-regulated ATPase YchF [Spirochaetota bacterium]|nr:redox-regulated ATPase YchF [Spirochaetota bacterium]